MDIQHQLLKVNPPEDIAYKQHSATLKIVGMLQAKKRLRGEPQGKDLVADVIIYKHAIQ